MSIRHFSQLAHAANLRPVSFFFSISPHRKLIKQIFRSLKLRHWRERRRGEQFLSVYILPTALHATHEHKCANHRKRKFPPWKWVHDGETSCVKRCVKRKWLFHIFHYDVVVVLLAREFFCCCESFIFFSPSAKIKIHFSWVWESYADERSLWSDFFRHFFCT